MAQEIKSSEIFSTDVQHEPGQDNIHLLGLDIQGLVFLVSAVLGIVFVAGTLVFLDSAGAAFQDMRVWITTKFDWMFMLSENMFVVFCIVVACSRLGGVRLGGQDAAPHYGYPGWIAMLFAAGVGIGLMFFGVLEPVTHTLQCSRRSASMRRIRNRQERQACHRPYCIGDCTLGPCMRSSVWRWLFSASIGVCH